MREEEKKLHISSNSIFRFWQVLVALPIAIILTFVTGVYVYFYEVPHTILERTEGGYSVKAYCEAESLFTFIPRVKLFIKDVRVLEVTVNEGYDTLSGCVNSAVESVALSEDRTLLEITTENGTVKTARIVYLPRY